MRHSARVHYPWSLQPYEIYGSLFKAIACLFLRHKMECLDFCNGKRHHFVQRCVRCGYERHTFRRCGTSCPVYQDNL